MKITVIIPVFNAGEYIERCLKSVIPQKHVDEIVIVDDGSSDDSVDIISSIALTENKVRLYFHPKQSNQGRSASRNLAIEKSSNEWIAFLDADDYFRPGRFLDIEKQIDSEVDGIYGLVQTEYKNQRLRAKFPDELTGIKEKIQPDELFPYLTENHDNSISLISLLVRKKALLGFCRFDTNLLGGEDTDVIWRLAKNYNLIQDIREEIYSVRFVHGENSYFSTAQLVKDRRKFYRKWLMLSSEYSLSKKAINQILKKYIYYLPITQKTLCIPGASRLIRIAFMFFYYLRVDRLKAFCH